MPCLSRVFALAPASSSVVASVKLRLFTASRSALCPFGAVKLTSAPASMSRRAASRASCRTANIRAVKLPLEGASTVAPASRRTLTTATWFSAVAHIRGVWPRQLSAALTSAPRATSVRTAAVASGTGARGQWRRTRRRVSGSFAPASSSRSTMPALELVHASVRGVAPLRLAISTSAPEASSRPVIAASSRYTAQCSATVPSASGLLTSTPAASRASTVFWSPARAASGSRLSGAAAPAETTATSPESTRLNAVDTACPSASFAPARVSVNDNAVGAVAPAKEGERCCREK